MAFHYQLDLQDGDIIFHELNSRSCKNGQIVEKASLYHGAIREVTVTPWIPKRDLGGALRAQEHLGSYSQVPVWVQSVQTSIQNLSSTLQPLIQPTVDNPG